MAFPRKPGKLSPEALKTAVLEIISKHPDGITEGQLYEKLYEILAPEIVVVLNELAVENKIETDNPQGITIYRVKE